MNSSLLSQIQQIGAGVAFILFLAGVLLIAVPAVGNVVHLIMGLFCRHALPAGEGKIWSAFFKPFINIAAKGMKGSPPTEEESPSSRRYYAGGIPPKD